METAPRKRSWLRRLFRFSLVTFLVAIGILAGVFGWLRHRAEQQRLAVEWITSQGGEIRYTHYRKRNTDVYYTYGSPEDKAQRAALRPENTWLANTLGEHYVHRIESVVFHRSKLQGEAWRLQHAYGAKTMTFWECDVSAEVLEALGRCRSVEEVSIADCECDRPALIHLAALPRLKILSLRETELDAGAMAHLGECVGLESLDLTYCQFPANDIERLRPLSKLTYVGLGFTSVTDRQLGVLAAWPKLQRLYLGAHVTDAGLDHLTCLTNLESLVFAKSAVTDHGIVKLVTLPKLKSVHLSDCRLSDELILRLGSEDPHWIVSYAR